MGKRFFLPFLLLAAAVSFLAPRLTGRGEKRIISPFVSTGELAKENQPFPAKRAASPLRAFKKVLGFRTSSSTSSIFPPPAAEGKRKTSLIREYLSKAADGLFGQVLGLKDEIALGPTSTPTATPSPTPGSAEVTATPIPTATPTSVPSLTPTPNPESELTADQQETKTVAADAGEALVQKDYVSLYNLMVSDFRSTYSEEEFLGSIGQGQNIVGAQTVSEPEIFGANEEWGRVMLELAFSDGTTQRYLVITFREGEAWRIFGTEEVP